MQDRAAPGVLPGGPNGGALRPRRVVAAAIVGTTIEYYDYAVFGYLAVVISPLFFPSENPVASLLAGLATFGVSFVVRPLGGIVLGRLGDRLGRRAILLVTVLGMGTATSLIGVLPTHQAIGLAAPVALVVCRLAQGFSAGAEIGGAQTYVAESAPTGRRGVMVTSTSVGVGLGFILAAGATGILHALLSADQMSTWGWRIPFLIAVPMAIACALLRTKLEDSPEFKELVRNSEVARSPLREVFRTDSVGMGRVAMIATAQNAGTYITLTYMTIHLTTVLDYDAGFALWVVVGLLALAVSAQPFVGALSDRVGRLKLLLVGLLGYLILPYPALTVIGQGGAGYVVGGVAMLFVPFVFIQAASGAAYTEMLGRRVRITGVSLGFNVGAIIGGGTSPYLATALTDATGNSLAPAYVLMIAAAIGLLAMIKAKERAHSALRS